MSVIWSFLKSIPSKVWGFVVAAGAVLLLLWSVFQSGRKQAKTEAEIKDLKQDKVNAETITAKVTDDVKIVNEVEKEIHALPTDALADRARKWVRKQPS